MRNIFNLKLLHPSSLENEEPENRMRACKSQFLILDFSSTKKSFWNRPDYYDYLEDEGNGLIVERVRNKNSIWYSPALLQQTFQAPITIRIRVDGSFYAFRKIEPRK